MKILYLHDHPLDSEKANIIQVLHMCQSFSFWGDKITLAVPESRKKKEKNSYLSKDYLQDQAAGKIGKKIKFSLIPYSRLTLKGRFTMVGGILGVSSLINRMEKDIDCCYVRNPIFLNLTLRKNIPTIFESHGSIIHNRSKWLDMMWRRNLVKKSRSPYLIKFITVSHRLAQVWKLRGVPSEKLEVFPDGFDEEAFSVPLDKGKVRKELNLPLNQKIVVYAGSLYPNRGIESILKLTASFPRTLFLVLGGPGDRKLYYQKLAQDSSIKNLILAGYVPHYKVKKYLFAADVLLMLWTEKVKTIRDCSPLKMFEYMATGRIIVGQAFPSIKEVLTDGQNAYLAHPQSFEHLKQKLKMALEADYPHHIAQAARKLAFDRFTWKKRAKEIKGRVRQINLVGIKGDKDNKASGFG